MIFSASLYSRDFHYCKHCDRDFKVKLADDETGDFFLVCPGCKWKHYRRIEKGVAVHADISKRLGDPIEIGSIAERDQQAEGKTDG